MKFKFCSYSDLDDSVILPFSDKQQNKERVYDKFSPYDDDMSNVFHVTEEDIGKILSKKKS